MEKFVNQVRQQTGLTAGIIRLRLNERANSYLCKNGPRTIIYSYGCGHPAQGKSGTETVPEVLHAVDSINSYLGCFRHCNEYNTRRKVLQRMDKRVFKWVYIKGHYDVVAIKKKYKLRTKTLQRIRDGDY